MKKKSYGTFRVRNKYVFKVLIMSKCILLLILVSAFQTFSKSYSQEKISLDLQNSSLRKAFKEIEKNTSYRFLYNDALLPENQQNITLNVENQTIDKVMPELLAESNLTYKVSNNLVIIARPEDLNARFIISGTVTDDKGVTLPGVSIRVKSSENTGTTTDLNGKYSLNVPESSGTLVFSYIGYITQEVAIAGKTSINVVLKESQTGLNEVVVVAYGTQKKSSMVSSITNISARELKGPSSNLTTMLQGKVAGIISYQRSGEPGADNASFFIRGVGTFGTGKVNPLILIDGIESGANDLARLQPDDIAGFSILKDATASSLFGARGANGVILVITKTGESGQMKFTVRLENSTSSNTRNFAMADNISYMNLANEAVLTRNPLGVLPYSQNKIDHTAKGDDPLLYPSNNWVQQLIKDRTMNQRGNLSASGGGEKSKYYLAMTYNIDNGILKENELNNFSNNIKLQSYSLLSNVTLNLTKTTEALISLKGQFDDYNGPIGGGGRAFTNALWSNPVAFPAVYDPSSLSYAKHPLFGNALIPGGGGLYINPYAESLSGFQASNTSNLTAQLNLKQNLKGITEGLSARVMAYTKRFANFAVTRRYSPYYYSSNVADGVFSGLTQLNDGTAGSPGVTPTEYLTYNPGDKFINSTLYGEAAVNYARTFNEKHSVGGMLIGTMRDYLTGNAPSLQLSLPSRNQGVSGRFTYGFDDRYLLEANFGYNGSERFAANHRFGFFPSVGAGWIVSNEKFFKPLLNTVNQLKFRFTYGLVGNDQIGRDEDRFFYLSDVNLNNGQTGNFGTNFGYNRPTIAIYRYENQNITWEQSKQTNIGMDLTLFKDLNITVDGYQQYRSNILMVRSTIPTSMGLQANISSNAGKAYSRGVDIAMDYRKTLGKSFSIQTRGTLTYAKSKLLTNEEPLYPSSLQHLTRVDNSLGQIYGLVAERLFIDDQEVANSPTQFGSVRAGDIKYRDINNDGKISNDDMVPIGHPFTPELIYGFQFSASLKNFDISAAFQGSARSSFLIDAANTTPFITPGRINQAPYFFQPGNQDGLLQVIADSHWSEENRDSYAFWPRLSNTISENNTQSSTWWLRNGSFLRLKSAEIGYNIPNAFLKKVRLGSGRIYVNGLNLFSISGFKLWDPEMGSSGLGYPIQKVYNVGMSIGI